MTVSTLVKDMCLESKATYVMKLFDKMGESGFQGDVLVYRMLINGLCKIHNMGFTIELHGRMLKENCQANVFTHSM